MGYIKLLLAAVLIVNMKVGECVCSLNTCSLIFLLTGEHFDVCTSVAARNLQISSLHPGSQVSAVSLPHPPTMSETEESLFGQLISEDFGLSGSPAVLSPNKVILTVDHKTREVLCVHLMCSELVKTVLQREHTP